MSTIAGRSASIALRMCRSTALPSGVHAASRRYPDERGELFDLVAERDRDALCPKPLDLPSSDHPSLGRADNTLRRDDAEPGKPHGLLVGEPCHDKGNLPGRDLQMSSD